jgi:hypothetical protein
MACPETGPEERRLLQDYVDVPLPIETLRARYGGGRWLAPLAVAAEADGETLLMRIGPSWAGGRITREVRVTVGTSRPRGNGFVVPIRWETVDLQQLFPVLEGDIEIVPLGERDCRIFLYASYIPPLGELGLGLDRALLYRAAESTTRSFLQRLATGLEGGATESG